MERLLCASEYGISLFSYDVMAEFLRANRVPSKKLLMAFQKKKKLYLDAIGQGVFFPMVQINHFDYAIRFAGMDEPFGDGWERKINYGGFNITVKNGLWVTGLGELEDWDTRGYDGSEGSYEQYGGIIQNFYTPTHIYYLDGDRRQTNSAFKIDIPDGKYLLRVGGFVHKDFEVNKNHIGTCGFYFTLDKTDAFTECRNPREADDYAFNIGSK